VLDADGVVRCFACRPPALAARVRDEAASAAPLSLPRPIAVPNAARMYTPGLGAAALPPLPFPLTTSPYGVRKLQRKPVGSVFVGLPAVSRELAQSLEAQVPREKHTAAKPKLSRRPLQKLALLTRILVAAVGLVALARRGLVFVQSPQVRAWLDARHAAWQRTVALVRARAARAPIAALRALRLGASPLQRRGRALATRLEQHVEPRARALLARMMRHSLFGSRAATRAKSSAVHVDPSRPIHL
jgi:hypothetical protein